VHGGELEPQPETAVSSFLILLAFITANSNLEPLLEDLFAHLHVDLGGRGFELWSRCDIVEF